MRTKIIKIGNSRGIRIPKVILHQMGIKDEVSLQVEGNRIILQPIRDRRSGWRDLFREMALHTDDRLLDGNNTIAQSSWDTDEWVWDDE